MVGEAFIESTAFASNNWALSHFTWLNNVFDSQTIGFNSESINSNNSGSMIELITAALFAGKLIIMIMIIINNNDGDDNNNDDNDNNDHD